MSYEQKAQRMDSLHFLSKLSGQVAWGYSEAGCSEDCLSVHSVNRKAGHVRRRLCHWRSEIGLLERVCSCMWHMWNTSGGIRCLVPSSPFRWLVWIVHMHCMPHCSQITGYSRFGTGSYRFLCNTKCQFPPAEPGSRNTSGTECANTDPWNIEGTCRQFSPHSRRRLWEGKCYWWPPWCFPMSGYSPFLILGADPDLSQSVSKIH